jgi:uncharacterized protein YcfJ
MKKIIAVALVWMMGIMVVSPSVGYTHSSDRDRGYSRPVVVNNYNRHDRQPSRPYNNIRYERSHSNNDGLLIAGAALGALALGAIIGNSMSQPRYATNERVVYGAPPSGPSAYADAPPGQWITVQGQWVNGQWVPAHNVWMPVNP